MVSEAVVISLQDESKRHERAIDEILSEWRSLTPGKKVSFYTGHNCPAVLRAAARRAVQREIGLVFRKPVGLPSRNGEPREIEHVFLRCSASTIQAMNRRQP